MYALRPATNDDFDFLYKLHEATLRVHVEAIWSWNEAVQHKMLHESLGRDPRDIVIVDGSDCGVVGIAPRPGELFMHMIALHPRVQRRGIGASLVRDFIARAEAARLPAALRVFKINVGARRLYQRLGFVIVGETETHYDMRCG